MRGMGRGISITVTEIPYAGRESIGLIDKVHPGSGKGLHTSVSETGINIFARHYVHYRIPGRWGLSGKKGVCYIRRKGNSDNILIGLNLGQQCIRLVDGGEYVSLTGIDSQIPGRAGG